MQIGQGRTGDGYSYIDLIGDATYTDYGLRVIRNNTVVANTTSAILHRGTGNLEISANDSASILLKTNGTTALTLNSSQDATFAGSVRAEDRLDLYNGTKVLQLKNVNNEFTIRNGNSGLVPLTIASGGNVTFAGDVTIGGKAYPKLFLDDNQGVARSFSVGTNNETFTVRNETSSTNPFIIEAATNNATFATQAFATVATSSGDASSTLTTKGYVDGLITGATIYRGTWDPDVSLNSGYGNPNLNTVTQTSGYYYICSADGAATPNGATTEPNSWNTR